MNVKITKHEHARITAPMSEREKVFSYLLKNNWKITRSGPPIKNGKSDITRLLILAERDQNEH
jgi:hypothetical protein